MAAPKRVPRCVFTEPPEWPTRQPIFARKAKRPDRPNGNRDFDSAALDRREAAGIEEFSLTRSSESPRIVIAPQRAGA
jgi:hypothetical protein